MLSICGGPCSWCPCYTPEPKEEIILEMSALVADVSESIGWSISSEIREKFDAFPERSKLAVALFCEFIQTDYQKEELIELINSIEQDPLDITTPCQRMLDIHRKFGVLELQRPNSDTLLIGCGNRRMRCCQKDHRNFDTLDRDLIRRPTIVTDCRNDRLAKYFESISKQYQRIIDEMPFAVNLTNLSMIARILKKGGTITIPASFIDFLDSELIIWGAETKIFLKTAKDSFRPPNGTYNYGMSEIASVQLVDDVERQQENAKPATMDWIFQLLPQLPPEAQNKFNALPEKRRLDIGYTIQQMRDSGDEEGKRALLAMMMIIKTE